LSEFEPTTFEDAAGALASAAADTRRVRILGGGTKLGWGAVAPEADLILRTRSLDRIIEHNVGDLTAVLEAGVPISSAQEKFAAAGQMLALDPPLGRDSGATIGGTVAAADSGPLRHRYGAVRDLVLGVTVALSDGTIARSGGKVIKNVAGYDLAKLFSGSFGTLGAILSVSVRLHPLPAETATALGASSDADQLARAAVVLAGAPLELDALDVAWRAGRGGLLARVGGTEAGRRAEHVAALMRDEGLDQVDIATDDSGLWARQRAGQRSEQHAIVRVAARPSVLAAVLRCCETCGGTLVGRAALGTSYVELEPDAVVRFRGSLPRGTVATVLDAPAAVRAHLDPWGTVEPAALELMRRVKNRFDPSGSCNPGVFVGSI
jgi:glycolate dehydrogenase FAD-binding subunit